MNADLYARWVQGDRAAGDKLYRRLAKRTHAIALRILRNHADAEEANSNLWVSLARQHQGYDPARGGKLSTWLLQCVRNASIELLRRRGREGRAESAYDVTGATEDKDATRDLGAALRGLSDEDRRLLDLRYAQDLPLRETARVLGTTYHRVREGEGQIIRALRRALGALALVFAPGAWSHARAAVSSHKPSILAVTTLIASSVLILHFVCCSSHADREGAQHGNVVRRTPHLSQVLRSSDSGGSTRLSSTEESESIRRRNLREQESAIESPSVLSAAEAWLRIGATDGGADFGQIRTGLGMELMTLAVTGTGLTLTTTASEPPPTAPFVPSTADVDDGGRIRFGEALWSEPLVERGAVCNLRRDCEGATLGRAFVLACRNVATCTVPTGRAKFLLPGTTVTGLLAATTVLLGNQWVMRDSVATFGGTFFWQAPQIPFNVDWRQSIPVDLPDAALVGAICNASPFPECSQIVGDAYTRPNGSLDAWERPPNSPRLRPSLVGDQVPIFRSRLER